MDVIISFILGLMMGGMTGVTIIAILMTIDKGDDE